MDQWRFVPFFLVAFGSPLPPSVGVSSTTELPFEDYDYETTQGGAVPEEVAGESSGSLIAGIVTAGFTLFTIFAIGVMCLWRMKQAEVEDILNEAAEDKYAELVAAGKIPKNESAAEKAKRIRLEKEKEERRRNRKVALPVEKDPAVLKAGLEETPSIINEKAITRKKNRGKLLMPVDVETADIETENMTELLTKGEKDTDRTEGTKVAIESEMSMYKIEELDSARQVVPVVDKNLDEREKISRIAPDDETAERMFIERQMARLERKKPTVQPTQGDSTTDLRGEESEIGTESVKEDSKLDSGLKNSKFRAFFAKILKKPLTVPETPRQGTKKKPIARGSKGTSSKKKKAGAPTKPSDSTKKDETSTTSKKKPKTPAAPLVAAVGKATPPNKDATTSTGTTVTSNQTATTGPTAPPKTGTPPAGTTNPPKTHTLPTDKVTPPKKTDTLPTDKVTLPKKTDTPTTSDTASTPKKQDTPSTDATSSSRKQAIAGVKAEAGNKEATITTTTGESVSSTPPPANPKK